MIVAGINLYSDPAFFIWSWFYWSFGYVFIWSFVLFYRMTNRPHDQPTIRSQDHMTNDQMTI